MFKSFIAIALASLFLFPNICLADSYKVTQPPHKVIERIEKNVGIIDIIGEIDQDTYRTVHKGFQHFHDAHVIQIIIHLNSLGGSDLYGFAIIDDMNIAKKQGIDVDTYVDHQEVCASMCTGIYATGAARMSAPDTLWIFHAPVVKLPDSENTPEVMKEIQKQVEIDRARMLQIYKDADPDWTAAELENHVKTPNNPLVITGAHILQYKSKSWITMEIND